MPLFALLLSSLLAGGAFTALLGFAPGVTTKLKPIPGALSESIKPKIANNPEPVGTPAWLTGKNTDHETGGVFSDRPQITPVVKEFSLTEGFNIEKPSVPQNEVSSGSPLSPIASNNQFEQATLENLFDVPSKVKEANAQKGIDLIVNRPKDVPQEHFQEQDEAPFTIDGLNKADLQSPNDSLTPIFDLLTAAEVEGTDLKNNSSDTIADTTTSKVPSPLPLLGAGVALGYARRLRQRLSLNAG